MVATVRLNSELENILDNVTNTLNKKRSDVIREAIKFYAKSIENSKKNRFQKAIKKTKDADFKLYKNMEDTLDDGL